MLCYKRMEIVICNFTVCVFLYIISFVATIVQKSFTARIFAQFAGVLHYSTIIFDAFAARTGLS